MMTSRKGDAEKDVRQQEDVRHKGRDVERKEERESEERDGRRERKKRGNK